ncbi:MAG: trypsin-like peptidase domain-containing protein [Planctomycetales bacterium]|nr:trypsin-like peptidase domain-containing protein [Planctomycetales bacterium]
MNTLLCLGRSVFVLAMLLGWSACCAAAPRPSVARIVVQERGAMAYGSGTLIDVRDRYGLVVTNWHVVCDAAGKIEVVFPGGFRSEARAVKLDEDWDLAALVIWRPPTKPVPISARPPRPGEPLTICGYGQGEYREATGRCTDFYAPEVGMPHELVELSVEARQGDSGGPILNSRGELAGVLFGAGQGVTLGSFAPRVETFLATLAPNIGAGDKPGELPSTPAMIATAPPAGEERRESMPGPRVLDCQPCRPCNEPGWPTLDGALAANKPETPSRDAFQEWESVDPAKPDEPPAEAAPVASITGVAPGGEQRPEWFDSARNVLAVIGLTFLFLQLVRIVS